MKNRFNSALSAVLRLAARVYRDQRDHEAAAR